MNPLSTKLKVFQIQELAMTEPVESRYRGLIMKNNTMFRKIVIPLISFLIILFSVLTIWALITPPVMTETVPRQNIYRSISYDYKVYPYISTLYPEGTAPLRPGEGPFFEALTDRIVFSVIAEAVEMTNDNLELAEVDFSIIMLIRSPEQWEFKIDDFDPTIAVNSSATGTLEYTSTFDLPLEKAIVMAETIAEETEIRPKDSIQLVIQSNLVTRSGERQRNSLTAEHEFYFRGSLIECNEELYFHDDQLIIETKEKVNYLNLFGMTLEVSMGRYLFPPFLTFSLLAGGYIIRGHQKAFSADQNNLKLKRAKLKKRYASRIIEINELTGIVDQKAVLIRVKEMKELVRVADELERPILQYTTPNDTEESITKFYVVGEEAIYKYKV